MGGFDAGAAVEALDYDFTAFLKGVKGTIPEPSKEAQDKFFDRLRKMAVSVGVDEREVAGKTREEIGQALAGADEDKLRAAQDEMRAAVCELGAGKPTAQHLAGLPPRIEQAFYGWLIGELSDPTPSNAATRRSLAMTTNGSRST